MGGRIPESPSRGDEEMEGRVTSEFKVHILIPLAVSFLSSKDPFIQGTGGERLW